jgi:uncharacterized protein (DUF2267 family)
MDYAGFLTIVGQVAGVDQDGADRATRATLQTLGERIPQGEALDLVEQLPPEVAPWLHTDGPAEGFDLAEFLRRVAAREEVDVPTAERHASGVLVALARAVSDEEWSDLLAVLPREYVPLLPKGPDIELLPTEAFVSRVAERAGLDPGSARRATDAVLETVPERIADGEVDDLALLLDFPLREPLRRGKERSPGPARRMPLETFLAHVAEREGVDPLVALSHAPAVFTTLREAVGDQEFRDVTAQLGPEYAALWAA